MKKPKDPKALLGTYFLLKCRLNDVPKQKVLAYLVAYEWGGYEACVILPRFPEFSRPHVNVRWKDLEPYKHECTCLLHCP